MRRNKSIKNFINYFLGPLLFLWLSYSIYRQITGQPQLEASWWRIRQSFQSWKVAYLMAALLLVPLNWGLEALKWQHLLRPVHPVSLGQAFKAVLSGISFSVTMPNRVGEYLGRMVYLPEGQRLKTISLSLVGSLAQLLVTLIAGEIGLVFMRTRLLAAFPGSGLPLQFLLYGLLLLIVLLLLVYSNVAGAALLFRRWIRLEKYYYLVEALKDFRGGLLLNVLLLSALRYGVFLLQYGFVFALFEVNVSAATVVLVMSVVFLAMAVIPSIALVEVWLRGEILIRLMGIYSPNLLGIGFTSATIWFVNLILPAIVGSLLILGMRMMRDEK